MANDTAKRIKQLSNEIKQAAAALCSSQTPPGSTAASYIKEIFVGGRGLLDLDRKTKRATAQGSDDENEGSQQDNDDNQSEPEKNATVVSDDEATDDNEGYDPAVMMEYLNIDKVRNAIDAKYHTEPPQVNVPGLRPEISPMDHQMVGCSVIAKSLSSDFKGVIIADPPGLGKTLQGLMGIASTRGPGDGPCVVVCPSSCVPQWADEIARFFYESDMKAIVLAGGEAISPTELFKYHVVITSYSQVASELFRRQRFLRDMEDWSPGDKKPKRPSLTLLSDIFTFSSKPLGKFLVLDEAHIIKNPNSRTYTAIRVLRERFEGCVMLTGTPLDNTWRDAFSLFSLLRGHPIYSPRVMSCAFLPQGVKKKPNSAPKGRYLLRIVQAMDAAVLRRPIETVQDKLTSVTKDIVQFVLPHQELSESNKVFQKYLDWLVSSDGRQENISAAGQNGEDTGLSLLIKATHWTNHPLLPDISKLESKMRSSNMNNGQPDDAIQLDENEECELKQWRQHLEQRFAWRSPRVNIIVDTINRHRDRYRDDAMVVMDESIFFLDILAIAFRKMFDPIPCFQLDGRLSPQQSDAVIEKFRSARGVRILLASRGTGGARLNLQCANVLIQCGMWWKVAWEEQSLGRIHRVGQNKPVFYYKIEARGCGSGELENCLVEKFRGERRDEKHATSVAIMNGVTRTDDAKPPERTCY